MDRLKVLWIVVCVLCAGCNSGSSNTVPVQPTTSPAPPISLGSGSVAILAVRRDGEHFRVLIFSPQSDKAGREFAVPIRPTSLSFAKNNRVFYGFNGGHNEFFVREVNVETGRPVRGIDLKPSWSYSSVATDDHNVLYVNTKSFVGGDVRLFETGADKPYKEIHDPLTPLEIYVGSNSLWVGFTGALSDGLARYDLRSTKQTWFRNTGNAAPVQLAANPDGSLIAAKVTRNGKNQPAVVVYDTTKHKSTQIHEGDTRGIASDDSGNLYIAQKNGRILTCTFTGCPHSFETNLEIEGLAWNPRDSMLYVLARGSNGNTPGAYVYNPRTTARTSILPVAGNENPALIAIEP